MNSVTGEEDRLESVLPLVAKHGAAVVAITNDESGISEDPDVRFEVARRIVSRAADHGIPKEDVVVDPLVMPIGALGGAGRQVFRIVRRLREELGVNSTCGASNVSFGLPNRPALNAAFLPMAIASGLTSAITSPLHPEMLQAVKAADVLMGNDAHCADWIARNGDSASGEATRGRRGGPRGQAEGGRVVTRRARRLHAVRPARALRRTGTTVLDAARRLGVDLDSVCGGRGICGRCQVEVSEGEHAKHGIVSGARPPLAGERARAALRRRARARRRDGGSAAPRRVAGDLVIDVPPESQLYRQVVRKEADARDDRDRSGRPALLRRGRACRARRLDRRPAAPARGARAPSGSSTNWTSTRSVLPALQPALRAGDGAVTVAVHDGSTLTAVWPGLHDRAYGIAFDIGSTTVAGHLCDLATGRGARVGG